MVVLGVSFKFVIPCYFWLYYRWLCLSFLFSMHVLLLWLLTFRNLQVCLEGQISHQSAIKSLSDGHQPFGDQIPWKFCEQFRDTVFPSLSGARIVRIATHPSAMRVTSVFRHMVLLQTRFFQSWHPPYFSSSLIFSLDMVHKQLSF